MCLLLSKIPQHFAARARAQAAPARNVDAVAYKPHRAIREQKVDASGVETAGGGERFIVAGIAAIPLPGRVGRVIVVVKRIPEVPVNPLPAAGGDPGPIAGAAIAGCWIVPAGNLQDDEARISWNA